MSLLNVQDLAVTFAAARPHMFAARNDIHALRGVSFEVEPGETLAVVGESGSGKSTMARAITRLAPAQGKVDFAGTDLLAADKASLRAARRGLQMVFQDPFSSLNRRMKIADILAEPLRVHRVGSGAQQLQRVAELIEQVGLNTQMLSRSPAALSGGQRQRIAIARALALQPRLVICDEAVSALDVSVQAQILNLLGSLKRTYGLAYLFITHDLSVVRRFADRIAVMHAGRIVELAPAQSICNGTLHPYTRALLSAVPQPDRNQAPRVRIALRGEPVSPLARPLGCLFSARCAHFRPGICDASDPPLVEHARGHQVACHRAEAGVPVWANDEPAKELPA